MASVSPLATATNPLVGEVKPPTLEPFIGIMTREEPPMYKPAILPRTRFAVFGTPANPDASFRWVLVSISPNGRTIKLRCDCTVPGCTRTAQYTASYKGVHPSRER